jgi:ammonium transporter, Amt family
MFDRLGIDDPCGAISVHGMNGAWGVLAVGLFADGTYGIGWNGVGATSTHGVRGLFYGDVGQLGAQMFHVVIGFIWAWGITWLIFSIAKNFMKIRVSPEVELEGLDVPEFGVLAYPDFVLHHSPAGHVATDAEPIGNGAPQTVDLERS